MKIKHMFMLPAIAGMMQLHAQQSKTANSPVLPIFNGTNSREFWSRAGNTAVNGGNNIFGTTGGWNSPIYTVTNGFTRTRLNGDLTTTINTVAQNVSGYLGLSFNPGAGSVFDVESPRTMLHIDGPNNTPFSGDWRRWMRTGTYYRENSDAMYVGMKPEAGTNRSDAVVNWSDDAFTGGGSGPDALRFIFTSTSDGNGGNNLNPRSAGGLNGYEYMRMLPYPFANSINSGSSPIAHIGIGPLFGNTALDAPKARLHSHTEDWFENYFQWSNEQSTGMAFNDGLKMGIGGYNGNADRSGHAYIYNQENRSILFSTNHIAPSAVNGSATNAQNTEERMRITSISAPTNLTNGGNAAFGVWNPGALTNQDVTRVAISHNPATPVTRPLALLHLGYNTGNTLFPLATPTTDGWRPWMDVGTFASEGTDNAYFGLKKETGFNNDRQDAVISWGDNYSPTNQFGLPTGIDKLRIIFTTPEQGQPAAGPGAMSTADGLEFVRYVPFHNASLGVNDPRTGFGDFENLLPVGTINPGNTIEINSIMNGFNAVANTNVTGSYVGSTGASGLRFRDLTSLSLAIPDSIADSLKIDRKKVLSVDSLGNVVLINGGGGGNGLGNICGTTPQNPLLNDWEIPTNNFNYRFIAPTGTNTWGKNYVGIGTSCSPSANLDVVSRLTSANPLNVIAMNCKQTNLGSNANFTGNGLGLNILVDTTNLNNIGNRSNVRNATNNYAFYGTAITASSGSSNQRNVGVYAEASKAPQNFAMRGRAVSNTGSASGLTIGGWFSAENSQTRIGVMGDINGAQFTLPTLFPFNHAIGVYGWNPSPSATEYAGYFEGKVNVNGALTVYGVAVPSDATLKTNIDTITNASAILKQIEAKSFYFDTTNVNGMKFSSQKQYGVIAQQVETVLPELINNNHKPAMVDSAGTVVYPAKSFKTVNYTAFIGLLIKANQEQQRKIDSLVTKTSKQDSINNAVQQQLAALTSQINACCSNSEIRSTNNATQTALNQLDVELSDKDAIVLNQNVPNPFAEQTTITYNVPSSVGKAQIIFFNNLGQIIQTVDIKTRGKGKVNVFASDLSSGLYNYTLVADGKVIDSKKMVRE